MSTLDINELGEVIRKVRKERGLRLNDLADDNISQATISNIERGIPHVHAEKRQYLIRKLGIEDKLPELLLGEQKALKDIKFQLYMIEVTHDTGKYQQAYERLMQMELDDDHPYAATYHYLKGECHLSLRKWKKAERDFYNAIRIAGHSSYDSKSNIEAAAFDALGRCIYFQGDLNKALDFVDSALDAYNPKGERSHLKYTFLHNQVVYLQKLARDGEAMRIIDQVWEQIGQVEQSKIALGFYVFRSDLLCKSGVYDEAIQCALDGLEKSRITNQFDCMFDLWSQLGVCYFAIREWEKAESALKMALDLKEHASSDNVLVTVYSRLGVLYMEQEKWDQAQGSIQKAIEIGEKANSPFPLSFATLMMGDLLFRQGMKSESISYYKKTIKLARKNNYKKREYRALLSLSRCWEGVNEQEFDQCLRNMYIIQQELRNEEVDYLVEMG